ncbi:hypothetical protein Mth01_53010 [Sphaerimonospora thailandensis]|uniref:Uncharacterized protein n=1 Tax=Sphaerimonospora thailandensis TaxID=795644 RepID=A0A8J3RIN1_9ACTN|nr:hypothetical protein Mth01_53010 [Sphaerimonospora thailandensis]
MIGTPPEVGTSPFILDMLPPRSPSQETTVLASHRHRMYRQFSATIKAKHDRFQQVSGTVRPKSQLSPGPLFILVSKRIGDKKPSCLMDDVLVSDAVLERGPVHLQGSKRNTKRLVT